MEKEKLLNMYERGLINSIEYDKQLAKIQEENSLELHKNLEKKLIDEYAKFTTEMLKKTNYEIMNCAYEITCKQEIQDVLRYSDLDDNEIKALLDEDDILNDLYQDWLDDDSQLYDSMEICILDSVANVTKYYNKRQNKLDKERGV